MLRSQIPIEEMFDLDSALTMFDADDFTDHHEKQHEDEESKAKATAGRLLDQMPTVATPEGGGHCAVCTEGLRVAAAVAKRIPCGHVFHENCISQWLSVNYSCPLCREKCPEPEKIASN